MHVISSSLAANVVFKKLHCNIIYSNMKFFDINHSGGIMNRLSSDIIATDDEIPFNLRILIDDVV